MKIKNIIIITASILILALVGGWWRLSQARVAQANPALEASGSIEARKVSVSAEVGGQAVEVQVEEGQPVKKGQVLVTLDDALLQTQRTQANALLQTAQANLALLKAGATPSQVKAAEAALAQAEANLRLVQAGLDTATAGTRPESIAAAQSRLDQARSTYDGLIIVLNSDQLEKVRSALSIAENNLVNASDRKANLEKDVHNPAFAINAAAAAVANAQTSADAARRADEAAQDPQKPYYLQIEAARSSWDTAQFNQAQAQARLDGLESDQRTTTEALNAADTDLKDVQDLVVSTKAAYDALTSGLAATRSDAAWQEVQSAQTQLNSFTNVSQGTGAGAVSVENLLVQLDSAYAARDLAAANLASVKEGARPEQVQAAQAQVDSAQAQIDSLDVQLKKFTITAPWDGVVLTRSVEPGQVVSPGGILFEIGRLSSLELTVYLPEDQLGLATLNKEVGVSVDAYPGRTFAGTVSRLANEAEFTPTNVQTKEDRTRLVYAVTINLKNDDLALKPGMIADVTFK